MLDCQPGLLGKLQASERACLTTKGKWYLTPAHKFAHVWTCTQMSHIKKGRRSIDSEPMENGAEWGWGNEPTEMRLRGGGGARAPAQEQEVGNTKRLTAYKCISPKAHENSLGLSMLQLCAGEG